MDYSARFYHHPSLKIYAHSHIYSTTNCLCMTSPDGESLHYITETQLEFSCNGASTEIGCSVQCYTWILFKTFMTFFDFVKDFKDFIGFYSEEIGKYQHYI